MKVGEFEIPFEFKNGLIILKTWRPPNDELKTCPILMLTSDAPWNPADSKSNGIAWNPDSTSEREIVRDTEQSIMATRLELNRQHGDNSPTSFTSNRDNSTRNTAKDDEK